MSITDVNRELYTMSDAVHLKTKVLDSCKVLRKERLYMYSRNIESIRTGLNRYILPKPGHIVVHES